LKNLERDFEAKTKRLNIKMKIGLKKTSNTRNHTTEQLNMVMLGRSGVKCCKRSNTMKISFFIPLPI
jgi:hypothetical protein